MATHTLRIFERGQRAVDRTDDFPEKNLRWVAFETIAAFNAALTLDQSSVFEFKENEFQKFFGQIFGSCDLTYLDRPFLVASSQEDEGFEGVKAFLGNFHELKFNPVHPIISIDLVDS